MPGEKTRVPWRAFLVAAGLWVALCLAFAIFGCKAWPAAPFQNQKKSRFEMEHKQRLPGGGRLWVIRDTETGAGYLLYKDGGVALCPLVEKKAAEAQDCLHTSHQVSRGTSRTLRVVATGYTAGPESTGKKPGDPGYGVTRSGLPAARGVCAVDPSVIPFGTVLYVPGYGYAVAADTGSAIKGNRIDLFFPTVEEAEKWGVREIDVRLVQ